MLLELCVYIILIHFVYVQEQNDVDIVYAC